jgi:hypothetical protein
MNPGLVVQDLDGYLAALRRRLAFRFVTRVAASPDDFFAVDFVAFFGVIFFSATWFTSPSRSRPRRAHNHTRASSALVLRGCVSHVTRAEVTSVTETM